MAFSGSQMFPSESESLAFLAWVHGSAALGVVARQPAPSSSSSRSIAARLPSALLVGRPPTERSHGRVLPEDGQQEVSAGTVGRDDRVRMPRLLPVLQACSPCPTSGSGNW